MVDINSSTCFFIAKAYVSVLITNQLIFALMGVETTRAFIPKVTE